MSKPKFKRTDAVKYSKLGVRRKKLKKYRAPKGRDNKLRLNMKGHTRKVKIGFKNRKETRHLIKGKKPVLIHNVQELKNIKDNQIGIIAKVGNKKRIEIAQTAKNENILLLNLNPDNFLKKIEEKMKKAIGNKKKTEKKEKLEKEDKKENSESEEKVKEEKNESS